MLLWNNILWTALSISMDFLFFWNQTFSSHDGPNTLIFNVAVIHYKLIQFGWFLSNQLWVAQDLCMAPTVDACAGNLAFIHKREHKKKHVSWKDLNLNVFLLATYFHSSPTQKDTVNMMSYLAPKHICCKWLPLSQIIRF